MEKEPQPDSLTAVTVKEYAPSEVYSSEPPPAYQKLKSSSVQIARIAAGTIILCSVILGCFWLASTYLEASTSCAHLQQELQLLQEAAFDHYPLPAAPQQPEALTQEEPAESRKKEQNEAAPSGKSKQMDKNSIDSDSDESSDSEEDEPTEVRFKLPLQLDFDDIAGTLLEKNLRSKMNCVVEKKKAEQFIDHQAKMLALPFGLNLTTDPKLERLTGERMSIFCESGNDHSSSSQSDQDEDTIMIQPVIIPIPNMNGNQLHGGPMMHPNPMFRPPMMDGMRPGMMGRPMMPPPPPQHQQPPQPPQQMHQQMPQQPHPVPSRQELPPRPSFLQEQFEPLLNIAQQIINDQLSKEEENDNADNQPEQRSMMGGRGLPIPEAILAASRLPEEVLAQMKNLGPNQEMIVSVSEPDDAPQSDMRVVQHQRQSAQEVTGRQDYVRRQASFPITITQQMQVAPTEEARPHYVQPRSVRSVDSVLHREKRVKRCSCDCAC